jgi:hypothetical protein
LTSQHCENKFPVFRNFENPLVDKTNPESTRL